LNKLFALCLMCLVLAFSLSAAAEQVLSPISPAYPLTEDVEAILKVAIQELGYTEGRDGSTKYGQWYGDAKAEWCAEFLCWSVNQAQEELGEKLLEVRYPLYQHRPQLVFNPGTLYRENGLYRRLGQPVVYRRQQPDGAQQLYSPAGGLGLFFLHAQRGHHPRRAG